MSIPTPHFCSCVPLPLEGGHGLPLTPHHPQHIPEVLEPWYPAMITSAESLCGRSRTRPQMPGFHGHTACSTPSHVHNVVLVWLVCYQEGGAVVCCIGTMMTLLTWCQTHGCHRCCRCGAVLLCSVMLHMGHCLDPDHIFHYATPSLLPGMRCLTVSPACQWLRVLVGLLYLPCLGVPCVPVPVIWYDLP